MSKVVLTTLIATACISQADGQQIPIGRIEQMPNLPTPYSMRNWKQVALGFDSLVFNTSLSGQYLPLSRLYSNTVNYPGQSSFALQSYVGSGLGTGEGINCLAAVLGSSLVGIDKSNQNGTDWVAMCQEWFNKANGQNVYLNSPAGQSGDDWWYETMPNVFFYQLFSIYPGTGDFQHQFISVADRWRAAIKAMGGSTTPWGLANINHRAIDLLTMTPNNAGVPEPEAAGAIAWLLYSAYRVTGNEDYRIGAELALESLLVYLTNPSYELQLPYGTYVAARMNAEIGTTYDIAKMMNWCFSDGNGTLRQWGAIVGRWGGYDCSGLIGESGTSNDYAFFMNVVEQVGALVPLVRYDDRFARAIGKWVLNAANAARLFYPNFLPDDHQDSEDWAHVNDPRSTIAHEALHQTNPSNPSISPFATGDAIGGGWAPTNLALYGSSHVGILGGIIDTTSVPMILRLDLLKTDYFHAAAYPTFLLFNPYGADTSVAFDAGSGAHDLYNTVTKSFLAYGVSGVTTLSIPANSAVVVVIAPAGGTITHDLDKTLINGVVVDSRSAIGPGNYPPRIKSLSPEFSPLVIGTSAHFFCAAVDRDNDSLAYSWNVSGGSITGGGPVVLWTAPGSPGIYTGRCTVSDGHGGEASSTDTVQVVQRTNSPPAIQRFNAIPRKIDLGGTSAVTCVATDPDGDSLSYAWSASAGSVSGTGNSILWTAPAAAGNYEIRCNVNDSQGGATRDSVGVEVRDLSVVQTGELVAFYPFNGDASDASGHDHNGTVNGAQTVSDRFGHASSAFAFNGTSNSIVVPNDTGLNFQRSITLNFWMNVSAFYAGREQYVVSHGNWQNRWKVSLTPKTNTLRWTVKNAGGQVRDLDTETGLQLDSLYNVTAVFSGADMEIYLNGLLDAFVPFSGLINQTQSDLTIGQDLPNDNQYDFNGVLDDVRIYNYALSLQEIQSLYDIRTGVRQETAGALPAEFRLLQNYPNPFNPETVVTYQLPVASNVRLAIYDILGRQVAVLVNEKKAPGTHEVRFSANDGSFGDGHVGRLSSGIYFCRLEAGGRVQTMKMTILK